MQIGLIVSFLTSVLGLNLINSDVHCLLMPGWWVVCTVGMYTKSKERQGKQGSVPLRQPRDYTNLRI